MRKLSVIGRKFDEAQEFGKARWSLCGMKAGRDADIFFRDFDFRSKYNLFSGKVGGAATEKGA